MIELLRKLLSGRERLPQTFWMFVAGPVPTIHSLNPGRNSQWEIWSMYVMLLMRQMDRDGITSELTEESMDLFILHISQRHNPAPKIVFCLACFYLMKKVEYCRRLWYDYIAAEPPAERRWCPVEEIFTAFLISVIAGVVSYYICKWLDGDK